MRQSSPPPPAAPAPPPRPDPEAGLLARLLRPGGASPVAAEWGPAGAALGVISAVFVIIAGGLLLVPFVGTEGLDATLANQLVLSLAFVGVAVWIAARGEVSRPFRELGLHRPTRPRWIALTGKAFLAVIGFALVFNLFAQPEQTDATEQLGFDASAAGAIVAGFAIVIAAPFCEEVFFRGLLFGGLRKHLPFVAAAAASGIFFGAIHLATGNVAATVQLAILGIVLAWLYERTGSLWAPMALHGVNNAIAFAYLVST